MRAYKFISGTIDVLLTLLYIIFIFVVSCMFEFFPWHDVDGAYMLYMLPIWLPLCIVSIIRVIVSVVAKRFDKRVTSLACLNAMYIPLIFLLGFISISLTVLRVIGIISVITMILYIVLWILQARKSK